MSGGRQALACRPPFYSWGSFGLFAQEAIQERHDLGPGAVIVGGEGGGGGSDRDPLLQGPQDGLVIIRIALYICERITGRCGLGRAGSTPQECDGLGAGAACIGRECGLGGALCDTIAYRPSHRVRIVGIGGNIGKGYDVTQRQKLGLDGDCGARHREAVFVVAKRRHRDVITLFVRHCDGLHTITIIQGDSDRNGLAFRCVGGADRNAAVLRLLRYSYRIGGAATGGTDTYLLLQ